MMNKFKALIKHLWLDASDSRRAIPPELLQRLTARVAASEQRHSGQIRICVEASLPASYVWRLDRHNTMAALIRQRALTLFGKLRVWDTEHNNGVLIYVLLAEHAIEMVADRGLMRHVSPAQWQAMVARMGHAFREQRHEDGLTQALEEISALLVQHFPALADAGAHNELPDAPLLQ
ncbi:TLP18.3, Psb32 and MOLO-1 founding protein of phosphatase [Polaromonas sp. OV174]|uniref:TPM domain-containing protein n=1 Tax=Polaromonas sp. OV174 TaxID=1855300 RepID=UPI0008E5D8A4|nr:TPM domain-containing protein [Polaromonas sp. OV174]SFC08124.1 TLP18.3, Psb32 and MOLO-1 founding protein of phosphatase [Polaromonas sp. OV174]